MNETPSATPVYDPAMEPLVQRAVNDLAQNLGVAPEEIDGGRGSGSRLARHEPSAARSPT